MIQNLLELFAAAVLEKLEELTPAHISRRSGDTGVMNYAEMYPPIPGACQLRTPRFAGLARRLE
ncbi:MAG TPA: hypothetical protein VIS57_01630 [Xanthomonadales bacterium]